MRRSSKLLRLTRSFRDLLGDGRPIAESRARALLPIVSPDNLNSLRDHIQCSTLPSFRFSVIPCSSFSSVASGSGGGSSDATIEITSPESFQSVINLSLKTPVIIDAYATWCGPCKMLDPVLKAAVAKQEGNVVLGKMDIDSQALGAVVNALRITSVPTLFMMVGGRVADVRQGVMQPREIDEWISKAVELSRHGSSDVIHDAMSESGPDGQQNPSEILKLAFNQLRFENAKANEIAPLFNGILQHPQASEEDKAAATAGLSICAVLEGQIGTAKQLLESISSKVSGRDMPQAKDYIATAESWIELEEEAGRALEGDGQEISELQAIVQGDKRDVEAAYLLALKLFQAGKLPEAIDAGIQIVKRDKEWGDPPQAGKRIVAALCNAVGSTSDLGKSARRKLSNLWFI